MPTRYLKPGIRDSATIDALSPLAETLFYRLLVSVDDFGRFDARPAMVKAACYPVKDAVTSQKCDALLQELCNAGLIDVYMADGKPILQMLKWDNVPRARDSRFPAYADGCAQVYADARKPRTVLPVTGTETGTETETLAKRDGGVPEGFERFWSAYPRKQAKPPAVKAFAKIQPDDALLTTMLSALARQAASEQWKKDGGQFVPYPASWLNARRWEDEQPIDDDPFGLRTAL